jgi:hypothetical protein
VTLVSLVSDYTRTRAHDTSIRDGSVTSVTGLILRAFLMVCPSWPYDETPKMTDQQEHGEEQPDRKRKGSHKSPNSKVGRDKKPPLHSAQTTKNSHTSPRRIALRRKMNEALAFREKGLTYTAIAKQFRVSVSVVHGWVVQAMHALPIENAKLVLAMELKRLDGYLAAYHDKALLGDMPATKMCLRILSHRARLLGLFPEHGTMAQILVQAQTGEMQVPSIEFIIPSGTPGGERVSPADMAAPPAFRLAAADRGSQGEVLNTIWRGCD